MKLMHGVAAAAIVVGVMGAAQAALVDQGNGTVLDTDTNLIWLQDWSANGRLAWETQKDWAETLSFAGSSDWRLPEPSEFRSLFLAVGNIYLVNQFINVRGLYWCNAENASSAGIVFGPFNGAFYVEPTFVMESAVAVRAAAVPEPSVYMLMIAGASILLLATRRRDR